MACTNCLARWRRPAVSTAFWASECELAHTAVCFPAVVNIALPWAQGLRPSRAEGIAGLKARSPARVSPTFRAPDDIRACAGRVIPLPGRRPSPCYPRSRRRAGVRRAAHPEEQEKTMAVPKFIDIDGRRFVWRELLRLRREQLAAAAKAEQPRSRPSRRCSFTAGRGSPLIRRCQWSRLRSVRLRAAIDGKADCAAATALLSSPAPSAHRCAAAGLDSGTAAERLASVPSTAQWIA
jgi:hypothetical protein